MANVNLIRASLNLTDAAGSFLVAFHMPTDWAETDHKKTGLESLRKAAEALGYVLVEKDDGK